MRLFGFRRPLPSAAFSTEDFHCGAVDTSVSERLLSYQRDTIADYYRQVARTAQAKRGALAAMPIIRWIVRVQLLRSSPNWRRRSQIGLAEAIPTLISRPLLHAIHIAQTVSRRLLRPHRRIPMRFTVS